MTRPGHPVRTRKLPGLKRATVRGPVRNDAAVSGEARNRPCICGSGKKTKRCCLARIQLDETWAMIDARAEGGTVVVRGPETTVAGARGPMPWDREAGRFVAWTPQPPAETPATSPEPGTIGPRPPKDED